MFRTRSFTSKHGVEIGLVEARSSRSGLSGRLNRINLNPSEIGSSGSHGSQRIETMRLIERRNHGRSRGSPDHHMELPVVPNLGIRLQGLPPVERNDVGIDSERRNRGGGLGELLCNQKLSSPVFEHEEHESVPDYALEDDDLDHEIAGEVAVHGLEEGDPHDQSVGQSGERKQSDHPFEAALFAEALPQKQSEQDDDFLEGVGGDELVVHGVGVVGGDEVEGE